MIYTDDNLKYCLHKNRDQFVSWRDEHSPNGFRPISISLAGPAADPIYSAVMVKRDPPFRIGSFSRLTKDQLVDKIDELAAGNRAGDPPLYPYLIAATGSGSDVIYAASFRAMTTKPFTRLNLFPSQYREKNAEHRAAGRILLWVDAFGTEDDIRYCAIWGENPDRIPWNADGINDTSPRRRERSEAMESVEARAALVAMTPGGGVARMYVDTQLKHGWHAEWNLSPQGFGEAEREQAKPENRRLPICIATTLTNQIRYSAIFARSDEIVPRTFRVRGPEPIGLDQANRRKAAGIDEWMENHVRAHKFRSAALAIVEGTRLVYAKGYTFAEPEYRDVGPRTLFRMASVSKTFCALAVWKALADSRHSLSSKMQSILGLTQPGGSPPLAAKFRDIELRHLLESNSGIDQTLVRDHVYAVADDPDKPAQPLTIDDLTANIAAQDMPGSPGGLLVGGKKKTKYGRVDYFLLSLVAAKLAGVDTFEKALKKLLLDPLHMTRTRLSRSLIEDRGDDEALHHPPDLKTATSAAHPDRRIALFPYGRENYEVYLGAGGISSAVIDVARLGAMLNCRVGNPLFSPTVLDELLSAAVAATTNGSDHGYYGFDSAIEKPTHIELSKGGQLTGVFAALWGRTGRRFIAIACNGDEAPGEPKFRNHEDDLDNIAAGIDWGTGDLFPHFDMPTLGMQQQPPFTPT